MSVTVNLALAALKEIRYTIPQSTKDFRLVYYVTEYDAKNYIRGFAYMGKTLGGCFIGRNVTGDVQFHHGGLTYTAETFVRKIEADQLQAVRVLFGKNTSMILNTNVVNAM